MGQCVFGSNTAFLHTWTQRWNSGTRGVTGMEISQSISRGAVAKNVHGVETESGVKWVFRRFSLRSRLEKIAQIMEGAFFKLSGISNSYVYFNASLVTSDGLSWPHPTVALTMSQRWHRRTLPVEKMGNGQEMRLSERWMDIAVSAVTAGRFQSWALFSRFPPRHPGN